MAMRQMVAWLHMDELQSVLQCLPCVQDKCGAMRVSKSWLAATGAPAVWAHCIVGTQHRKNLLNGNLARLIERAAGGLEVLRVEHCLYITEDALVDLARNPGLRTLSLWGCLSMCIAPLLERSLWPCRELRELSVNGCDLESLFFRGGDLVRLPPSQALQRLREACHCDEGGTLDVEVCPGCESLAGLLCCATARAGPGASGFNACLGTRCWTCIGSAAHLYCCECFDLRCVACVADHPSVSCKKCGIMVCEACNLQSGRVFVCPQCKDGLCRACCSHEAKRARPTACAGCSTQFCRQCAEGELTECGGQCGQAVCVRCQEHIAMLPCCRCDLEYVCQPCCQADPACATCDRVICRGCRAQDRKLVGGGVCASCTRTRR